MKHRTDPKIRRLAATWLRPDRRDATWLARVADEVEIPGGSTLSAGRFAYVALDGAASHRIVASDTDPIVVDRPVTMLAIPQRDMAEAVRRIPALRLPSPCEGASTPVRTAREAIAA